MQIVTNPEITKAITETQTAQLLMKSTKEYLATVEHMTEKECEITMNTVIALTAAMEMRALRTVTDITGFANWRAEEIQPGVYRLQEVEEGENAPSQVEG